MLKILVMYKHTSLCIRSEQQGVWHPSGTSGKKPTCQGRRQKRWGFDPWAGKTPWRRKWQPTAVFFPEESREQSSLVGYNPWES